MANDTIKKLAMFVAGLAALEVAINYFAPEVLDSIINTIPFDIYSYEFIGVIIYGIAGVYTIINAFKK